MTTYVLQKNTDSCVYVIKMVIVIIVIKLGIDHEGTENYNMRKWFLSSCKLNDYSSYIALCCLDRHHKTVNHLLYSVYALYKQ